VVTIETRVAIVTDSYMGMIFPENIPERISRFLDGELDFPFINDNELMCICFLYGRKWKVNGDDEYQQVIDLAGQTYRKLSMDIKAYSGNSEIDRITELVRNNYVNRGLQITIEMRCKEVNVQERLFSDPIILSDCFARHIAYYDQDFFFQVYGPFKGSDLTTDIRETLQGRMVMIGYNRMDQKSLPFEHPLVPLYVWMREPAYQNLFVKDDSKFFQNEHQ
jgi:hypothetical protein